MTLKIILVVLGSWIVLNSIVGLFVVFKFYDEYEHRMQRIEKILGEPAYTDRDKLMNEINALGDAWEEFYDKQYTPLVEAVEAHGIKVEE